jgi:benzoylformate decarboxylase
VKFAEKLQAPVFLSPLTDRVSFPMSHPQFRGYLPMAIGPLSDRLRGFDLAVVVGAQVFRYYPFVAGSFLPEGTELLQITEDANDAGAAVVGDSILGDPPLALEMMIDLIPRGQGREFAPLPMPEHRASNGEGRLLASEAFRAIAETKPQDAILVNESSSNSFELLAAWPIIEPDSYYQFAGAALGWGAPAAVGISLALCLQGKKRPVVAVIGDGALQYSIQCLYTAAQLKLPVVFVVPRNEEYGVLKDLAALEKTPRIPGLDLPGLDIISSARGFGCAGVEANTYSDVKDSFGAALRADGPTVIVIPIQHQDRSFT